MRDGFLVAVVMLLALSVVLTARWTRQETPSSSGVSKPEVDSPKADQPQPSASEPNSSETTENTSSELPAPAIPLGEADFKRYISDLAGTAETIEEAERRLLDLADRIDSDKNPMLLAWISQELGGLYGDDPKIWGRVLDEYSRYPNPNGQRVLAGAIAASTPEAYFSYSELASVQLDVFLSTENAPLRGMAIHSCGYIGADSELGLMYEECLSSWKNRTDPSALEGMLLVLTKKIDNQRNLDFYEKHGGPPMWRKENMSPHVGVEAAVAETTSLALDFVSDNIHSLSVEDVQRILVFSDQNRELRRRIWDLLQKHRRDISAALQVPTD